MKVKNLLKGMNPDAHVVIEQGERWTLGSNLITVKHALEKYSCETVKRIEPGIFQYFIIVLDEDDED